MYSSALEDVRPFCVKKDSIGISLQRCVAYLPPRAKVDTEGIINYDALSQLKSYCKKEKMWLELQYVKIFFALRDNSYLCFRYNYDPYDTTPIHSFLSLSDLKLMKLELGKFSDDPDKYIDVSRGFTQTYELGWKL